MAEKLIQTVDNRLIVNADLTEMRKVETSGNAQIISQIYYIYKPMENITAYELALIVPILILNNNIEKMMKSLSPEAKRHFKECRL